MPNVLEVMGATAGALSLLDRLIENPKGRSVATKRKFTAKQIAAQKLFAKRAKAGTLRNPRGRSKRGVTRASQATGKATKQAPKGLYANPRRIPGQYVVQLKQAKGGEWITTTMHTNKGPAFAEAKRLHAANPMLAIRAVPYEQRYSR